MSAFPELRIRLPAWVDHEIDAAASYDTDESRMALVVAIARANVLHDTGGPFGAAIFEAESGRLVSVGVNMVVPARNAMLHAEVVAYMIAQASVGSFSLGSEGLPPHELFTSCEPCAMCLGATHWSGVRRVVWSASREDAAELFFDEGPVFPASYEYLQERGIVFEGGVMRTESRAVLELYRERGGPVYNG